MPPGTNAARVLAEIEELTNPKPRAGKKTVSAEAQALKAAVLGVLETARDDSDREHPVRLVFEPRTSRVAPEELMNLLLAHTSLESNAPMNLVAIDREGRPAAGGARALDPRVGRLPAGGARAAPAAPAGRGRRPPPHPRRPHDRLPQHRQGDQGHPRRRRAEARAHGEVRALRAPGRGHPRDPPAPAREARGHQDRARDQGAEGGAGRAREAARQRGRAPQARGEGSDGRRRALRRHAPHDDRGGRARRGRTRGDRSPTSPSP